MLRVTPACVVSRAAGVMEEGYRCQFDLTLLLVEKANPSLRFTRGKVDAVTVLRDMKHTRARAGRTLAGVVLLATTACEIEWGGGSIAFEDPAPPTDTTAIAEEADVRLAPIPDGPLLFLARLNPDGSARLVPVAGLHGEAIGADLTSVVFPDSVDEGYRARFDSTFLAAGAELQLHASGERIGTLILGASPVASAAGCPSVARGRALLMPGQTVPRYAFALPAVAGGGTPAIVSAIQPTRRMSVAGPVLAERLINDPRAFLAQRVALTPVQLRDDTIPGMAATYLVSDSLAAGPPAGDAISLFFLAQFDAATGYRPLWQEVRRYNSATDKEVFEYLDWIRLPAGRLDVLRRYGGTGVGLATSLLPEASGPGSQEVGWVEPAECSALELLESP
jgi:hypothetical protein